MGMDESYWDSGAYFFLIFTFLQNGVKVFIDEQMAFLCHHDAQDQYVILKRRQFAVAPLNTLSYKINFNFLPDNFAKAKLFLYLQGQHRCRVKLRIQEHFFRYFIDSW